MLETIKQCINNLPDKSFDDLYQEYIVETQNRIMNHQLNIDSHRFRSIDDINTVLKDLNKLTEELKK